jgi:hypothetical protein
MGNKTFVLLLVGAINFLVTQKSIAQKTGLDSNMYESITKFYKDNISFHPDSELVDSLAYYSKIEPLFTKGKKKYGIYTLTPSMDPKIQFILLVNNSYHPLKTKQLHEELPLIISFLRENAIKLKSEELYSLLEEISKVYKERNPTKNALLPK